MNETNPPKRSMVRAVLCFLIDQRPASFGSSLPAATVLRQLAETTSRRSMTLMGQPGLTGHVSDQYVYLTRQTALSSGGFRALFFGRVEPGESEADGCKLSGHFAMPWSAALIFTVGMVACAVWTLRTLSEALLGGGGLEPVLYSAGALVTVVVLFGIARWMGRRDERWLSLQIGGALDRRETPAEAEG